MVAFFIAILAIILGLILSDAFDLVFSWIYIFKGGVVVDLSGWNRSFLWPAIFIGLIVSLILAIILFLFLNLFGVFSIMLRSFELEFWKLFRFFDIGIFYLMTLGLSFGRFGVSKTTRLKAIVISIGNITVVPKSNLDLHIDGFLYEFFEAIELLTILLYLSLVWGL